MLTEFAGENGDDQYQSIQIHTLNQIDTTTIELFVPDCMPKRVLSLIARQTNTGKANVTSVLAGALSSDWTMAIALLKHRSHLFCTRRGLKPTILLNTNNLIYSFIATHGPSTSESNSHFDRTNRLEKQVEQTA